MAEHIDLPDDAPEAPEASLTRRARTTPVRVDRAPSSRRLAKPSRAVAKASAPSKPRPSVRKPMRNLFTLLAVAGLVATVAIPAYGAFRPEAAAKTVQQLAEDGAQTLVVASDVQAATLERGSYSATTPDEIAKKKAEEAAAARAKAAAAQGGSVNVDLSSIPVGTGNLGWPLRSMKYISDRFGARGGSHRGVDMLAPAMTPIYASADGVVSQSTEGGGGGYGAYVRIEHVIDGVRISTLYAHMSYGTRLVQAGETVSRGQQIGSVGQTGYATANHVHFEVFVNNVKVDPMPWLGPFGT